MLTYTESQAVTHIEFLQHVITDAKCVPHKSVRL